MGDAGHPYAHFRRALERGSLTVILSAAANLERIELADALAVCAVVARDHPAEYDRYAVRWIAAAIKQREAVDLAFLITAIGALERLRRDGDTAAAERSLGLVAEP